MLRIENQFGHGLSMSEEGFVMNGGRKLKRFLTVNCVIVFTLLLVACLAQHAYSYGFSAHMAHLQRILDIHEYDPTTDVYQLLSEPRYAQYFLYGSIFPDQQFGNRVKSSLQELYAMVDGYEYCGDLGCITLLETPGLTWEIPDLEDIPDCDYPLGFDTHDPNHGMAFAEYMLVQSQVSSAPGPLPGDAIANNEKTAFALGYYAHLSEDIVAHDIFIPRIIAANNLAALSIFKDPDAAQIPGESEGAVEVTLDHRLGLPQANLVKSTLYDVWVLAGTMMVPEWGYAGWVIYETEPLYGGPNPSLKFFHECLTQWYQLHPDHFSHPPISYSGLIALVQIGRFMGQFYPEAIGFNQPFVIALRNWIVDHLNWTMGAEIARYLPIIRDQMDHFARSAVMDRTAGMTTGSYQLFLGALLYSVSAANELASEYASDINSDEYEYFKGNAVFTTPETLLDPFNPYYKNLGAQVFKEIGPPTTDPPYPGKWYANWKPWNEYGMRYAVLSSLNNNLPEYYISCPEIMVYDCYFAVDGVPLRGQKLGYDQIGYNNLSAHVELFSVMSMAPVTITAKIVKSDGGVLKQASTEHCQDPYLYNSQDRTTIDIPFGETELASYIASGCNGVFIELYLNSVPKPFFTTNWARYKTLARTDATRKPSYSLFDSFNYWPYSLAIEGILSPTGGEHFKSGEYMTITWNVAHPDPGGTLTTIHLSTDPMYSQLIATNVHTDSFGHGSYRYHIPHGSGTKTDCSIELMVWYGPHVVAVYVNPAPFTIEYCPKPYDPDPLIPGNQKDPQLGGAALRPVDADYLAPAMPNPFNPQTVLSFGLKSAACVTLAIYDVNGRLIRSIYSNEMLNAGRYSKIWDGKDDAGRLMASGVYFLVFRGGEITKNQKLILVR